MTDRTFTDKELHRIEIMRDIFEKLEVTDHIYKLIDNLFISQRHKTILQLKYCEKFGNKNIAYQMGISERWLSSILNEALLASYIALRDNIRKGIVVPKLP